MSSGLIIASLLNLMTFQCSAYSVDVDASLYLLHLIQVFRSHEFGVSVFHLYLDDMISQKIRYSRVQHHFLG